MDNPFGKLILIQQGAPEQEFELGKPDISLGRALTNDIIISDARVSRSHARLEWGPAGCTLVDLGSSNGTSINGVRVPEKAVLAGGDVIGLGSSQLRFIPAGPQPVAAAAPEVTRLDMTMIDSEAMLDSIIDNEALPVAVNDNSIPRLVVITADGTWDVSLKDLERAVIGRADENEVVLDQTKVSRRHAEIIRRGSIFILRDLNSTNGTWKGDERVEEMILQNGDEFRIGTANIVYKSGFNEGELTMAEAPRLPPGAADAPVRRPVIFVPGMFGSQLWVGQERLWPNVKTLFTNPDILVPGNAPVEARGILDEVVIIPNLIKIDQYNRLGDYLVEELGYVRGVDFFEFAYDWRLDVRENARLLGLMVDSLSVKHPLTIIAHSMGTMVSRYYIERLGGKQRVDRAILMGGPHHGAVKALVSMLVAPDILPFGLLGEKLRKYTMVLPSAFQIIPTYPCAVDQNGNAINFIEDERWLDEKHLPLLRAGREFRRELGRHSSVPALSIFGYGMKTAMNVTVTRDPTGRILEATYLESKDGDSSIPQSSAVLEGSEIHPVQQYHGSLFVDNDVKMRLKLELTRSF